MKATKLFEQDGHEWIVFGRDPDKPTGIIDTNQYMIKGRNSAMLLDPGGVELFAPMLAAIAHHVPISAIKSLFASHQDPDIISSLGLWDKTLEGATLYAPWIWEGFIKHFGCEAIHYDPLPDEGRSIRFGDTELEFVPAHYLHSSGNFSLYDKKAKILMSGDIGAALLPDGAPFFVENFDAHTSAMTMFHQRWMPSNKAKLAWIERVRELEVDFIAPQHGAIFKGKDVGRFLDWFEALEVGIAV